MTDSFDVFDDSGYTSTVYLLSGDPPRICKAIADYDLFLIEKAVYERFSKYAHPLSILKYYGVHESIPNGLVLELAVHKNLHEYTWACREHVGSCPARELLYRWARQAAEALEFAHSVQIYNSDIHCINWFLDEEYNLKMGDWAGASIEGCACLSSYRLRHRLFDSEGTDVSRATGITASTEIFAFGTALYYMAVGRDLWPELREPEDREEIKRRSAGHCDSQVLACGIHVNDGGEAGN